MTETPERPNPLAVRHVAGRGWFIWNSFREKAISRDLPTEAEAERLLTDLATPTS